MDEFDLSEEKDSLVKEFIRQTIGGDLKEVSLVVVDESHNFRNPLSNRWENFFTLIMDHIAQRKEKPYILFLTVTPINNTLWDLSLLVGNDEAKRIRIQKG